MTSARMSRFRIHDEETAPAQVAALLKVATDAAGRLPNLLGVLAGSPATLRAYLRFRQELGKGELPAATRSRIALAVAAAHGGATTAEQARLARAAGLGLDEAARLRRWTSEDARDAALLAWLRPAVTLRGEHTDLLHETAREAGWSDGQMVEALAVATLESFAARVARAGHVPAGGDAGEPHPLRAVA